MVREEFTAVPSSRIASLGVELAVTVMLLEANASTDIPTMVSDTEPLPA